ncbi:MAG: sulfite exporter TauE/SafE family protein [Calothrix sp. SM1_7_51]|nr:sulfite exporter TauE/SafE family protein [Calothrix sp. SM1_7_51]
MYHNLFLFAAALLAGCMNSLAGGGGLIVFPALIISGVPPLQANATNTTALWFGTLASTFAYRRSLYEEKNLLILLSITSLLGGFFGSYLLLNTSPANFVALVPYLMLTATLLFTFSQPLLKIFSISKGRLPIAVVLFLQLAIATYGGYFGGGGGILMLAVLNMMGFKNIHAMNAIKTWLATCLNAVAIIYFSFAKTIFWYQAIFMAVAAVIGGYSSAYFAQKLNPQLIRYFVIGIAFAMTGYFFLQA